GLPRPEHASQPGPALKAPLLPLVMSRNTPVANFVYNSALRNPQDVPSPWLILAIKPAHNGAAALVPPTASRPFPSPCITPTAVSGSATQATSGTPRPLIPFCQSGLGNTTLIPPPPAPSSFDRSFHTVSLVIFGLASAEATSRVPPTPITNGL